MLATEPLLDRTMGQHGSHGSTATILVAGGGGFVGSAIIRAAAMRSDLRPIVCSRRPNPELTALGVEIRPCDATELDSLTRAFRGVTYVVNSVLGSPDTMIAATRNICEAARRSGVRRVVHISSMAVYGRATGILDETTELRPISAYGRAKAQCEASIGEFLADGGDALILRPGCVYGPGGQQWVGRIARWIRAGRVGDLGNLGEGICNLTFNDDLARAVVASVTAPSAAAQVFNVADSGPWTWNQYFLRLGREIGANVRPCSWLRSHVEAVGLALPLHLVRNVGQRMGGRPDLFPEPITLSLLNLWQQRMRLDISKAETLLDFPRTPTEVGVSRSAIWFQSVAG